MKYTTIAKLASRLDDVKPSATLALTQKARELAEAGHDVVSLTAGEPDLPPAAHIIEATNAALAEGHTRYTHVSGINALREAIARYHSKLDGVTYEVNEIVVSSGAKQAVYNACQALLDPGDEAIILAPYWLSYRDIVLLADGVPVVIHATEESDFRVSPSQLEAAITPRTKLLILNSPSNPTGATYDRAQLRALADVIARHPRVVVLSDDIYRRFSFGTESAPTFISVAPELAERTLVVDGCSKTFAMTGFRIGWSCGPRNIISAMARLQGQSTSNAATPSQYAALAALNGDQGWIDDMVRTFDMRRKFVIGRLRAMPGISCFDPKGAFYVFPNVSGLIGRTLPDGTKIANAYTLTAYFLHEFHLVVVPGEPFGAPDNIRLSFAASMETLSKGMERMQRAIGALL